MRTMLRPSKDMRATSAALDHERATTITRAQALPDDALHKLDNDE